MMKHKSGLDLETLVTQGRFFHHAVATPLSALLLSLELCQIEASSNYNQFADHLKVAKSAANRLKQVLATADPVNLESAATTFSVSSAVTEVVKLVQASQPDSTVRLVQADSSFSWKLTGSRFLFQEAVLCLITNGLEAYAAGQQSQVLVSVQPADTQNMVCLTVTDGGAGFANHNLGYHLRLGESSKADDRGVGLQVVNQVVTAFKGSWKVLPQPVGTSIQVSLPLT